MLSVYSESNVFEELDFTRDCNELVPTWRSKMLSLVRSANDELRVSKEQRAARPTLA